MICRCGLDLPGHIWLTRRKSLGFGIGVALLWMSGGSSLFAQQRLLGLDVSAWQGNISQTTWNNIRNVENRQFVICRSSRGGTTGYYNQNDANNNNGLNTLSQRYDDPYFVQNVNRTTTAGIYVGSYHFSRPDIIETTLNSGGIANSGADEADHFIQMAGAWMRPGYLMPVHDFEAGDGIRTDEAMAQFALDFSDRIYEVKGIRPAIYVNGNYAAFVLGGASASLRSQLAQQSSIPLNYASPAYPTLWSARWPNQANPNSIDVQNGEPIDSYAAIYGPWDDYGVAQPWVFWQYASTLRLQSFNNGGSNLDADVLRGGIEFLKDQLVPALWTHNGNGQWTTLTNWNCGLVSVAPVTGPGQVTPVGTQTLPTQRLPGAAGSGVTSGQHDTVLLDRPNANILVTLSSGTHNIRKLYMREALDITGGSLNVNYVPSADSTPNSAQFSGPVHLSGGSFSAHTLQVDAPQSFEFSGGTLSFYNLNLMPGATPASLVMTGSVTLNSLSNTTATIASGSGAGNAGFIDLGGRGAGTLRLTKASGFAGGMAVSAGRLLVNNPSGSGTGDGIVTVENGVLGGTGTIAGVVTVNPTGTIAPGGSIGTLTLNSAPILGGTTFMEIDRNGGASLADKLVLTSGALEFGGTLVVTNVGAALVGGEVFDLFDAPAYSGSFASLDLPSLPPGLSWDLSGLAISGTIRVNRDPVAGNLTFTNEAPDLLQIPIADLTGAASDPDGDLLNLLSVDLNSTNGVPLLTNATFVLYSNFVSVVDQFSYVLSDAHGGNATGVVHIAASPTGRFAGAPVGDSVSIELHFVGSPGWLYFLERSTNFPPAWSTIWTNPAPPSGLFDYVDDFSDLPAVPESAFYRLRWSP